MSSIRIDRYNEEIKKSISQIIQEMKDPRISPMTTITQVEITRDFRFAKARVSVYDKDEKVRQETVDTLNHASGFIVHEMGQRIDIRRLPQMKFVLDDSIAYSEHISKILNSLKTKESEDD